MLSKLRLMRLQQNVTQIELALKTGIPQSSISLFERSILHPNDRQQEKFADTLNVRVEFLFNSVMPVKQ
jgi:transcriptional regulator with XRE-family HTH domain